MDIYDCHVEHTRSRRERRGPNRNSAASLALGEALVRWRDAERLRDSLDAESDEYRAAEVNAAFWSWKYQRAFDELYRAPSNTEAGREGDPRSKPPTIAEPVHRARRGFAAMDVDTRQRIARAGGQASSSGRARDTLGQFLGRANPSATEANR